MYVSFLLFLPISIISLTYLVWIRLNNSTLNFFSEIVIYSIAMLGEGYEISLKYFFGRDSIIIIINKFRIHVPLKVEELK